MNSKLRNYLSSSTPERKLYSKNTGLHLPKIILAIELCQQC